MKTFCILTLFCCAIPALALSGKMEKATVHAMRKVPCMQAQPIGRVGVLSGFIGGAGSGPADECIEYELRTEKVSYIIRPHRNVLLLLGGDVSIKLADTELLLRTGEAVKDIRCSVLAMSLRAESEKAEKELRRPAPALCFEDGHQIPCPYEP